MALKEYLSTKWIACDSCAKTFSLMQAESIKPPEIGAPDVVTITCPYCRDEFEVDSHQLLSEFWQSFIKERNDYD